MHTEREKNNNSDDGADDVYGLTRMYFLICHKYITRSKGFLGDIGPSRPL